MAASSVAIRPASEPVKTLAVRKPARWLTVAGLSLLVLLGAFLRLHNLDRQSVSHVEMYVPGIRLPHGISVPEERLGLVKVVTSTLNSDTHPPAFYIVMWFWTKCFGTSAGSIRLPAALFGIASIPLMFWLGTMTNQSKAGWIAATLLAINGHQVFWSRVARMFTLSCLLGLLATILLLKLARQNHTSGWLKLSYVAVLLFGLCTHVFFWLILACHILWTAANRSRARQAMPAALKLQLVAALLGSPLLAFSAYQTGNTLATLSSNTLVYAREFVQFAFAFPLLGFSSGVYSNYGAIPDNNPHLSIARWLFFGFSVILFVAGCKMPRGARNRLQVETDGSFRKLWLGAGVLGTLCILAFIWVARTFAHPGAALRNTERMIALPLILAVAAILLEKNWARLSSRTFGLVRNHLVSGEQGLIVILATAPLLLLALISLGKPILNARGMLPLAPYLLLLLSAGIVRLGRNPVVLTVILLAVVGAQVIGLWQYNHMTAGRADYKSLAAALGPQLESTDLVFLHPEFYSTPLFFYMNSSSTQFVGRDYDRACRNHPQARVWVLWFYNYEPKLSPAMQASLVNYRRAGSIEVDGGQTILYLPISQ